MAELTPDEKAELRKAAAPKQTFMPWVGPSCAYAYGGSVLANPATIVALLDENARLESEVAELVRFAQDRETALAKGWAKLREEKRSIRELAWDEGRNSTDERNPYR